jgi:hypothetical protein
VTIQRAPDQREADHHDHAAGACGAEANGSPDDNWQRQVQKRRDIAACDRAVFFEREQARNRKNGRDQYGLNAPKRWSERKRAHPFDAYERDRREREAAQSIGRVPARPVHTVVLDRPAAENLHKRTAKSAKCGTNESCNEDIGGRFADASEPGRVELQMLQNERIGHSHRAVRRKSNQQLRRWHSNLQLGRNVRWKRRKNIGPPLSRRAEQERAKQNDVRRPERGENPVRKRADEKCNFGADIIGDRHDQCVAESLCPVLVRCPAVPAFNRSVRSEDIHWPAPDHINFMRLRLQPIEVIENA